MDQTLRISLLGQVEMKQGTRVLPSLATHKAQALFIYLLCTDRSHPREVIADLFWPSYSQARHNLRTALFHLRPTLGNFVVSTRQTLAFDPTRPYWVDVAEFERQLNSSQPDRPLTEPETTALVEALSLYQGDFMAGFHLHDAPDFEIWISIERERLHQQMLTGLERLVRSYLDTHDYQAGLMWNQRYLTLNEVDEAAHRQQMRLLALSGQRSVALSHYQKCQRILADSLGIAPSAQTMSLYEQIRDNHLNGGPSQPEQKTVNMNITAPSLPHLPQTTAQRVDWGEAPTIHIFYDRQTEQAQLIRWLLQDQCQLVSVIGMGGVGKTTLAAVVARAVAEQFDYVLWRSLLNAPPLDEILGNWLQTLSGHSLTDLPTSLNRQLNLLFSYLSQHRCLLVLDNVESILQPGHQAGQVRSGYEGYSQLILRAGQSEHQSCLLFTSREQPKGIGRLVGKTLAVRSLQLVGLAVDSGRALMADWGLSGSPEMTMSLITRCSGNPLALELIACTIQELFDGDIGSFLEQETFVFDEIWDILAQQVVRLSVLEWEILLWLAIERQPLGLEQIQSVLLRPPSNRKLLEALRALRRRSLLEAVGSRFTLQNVVMEYMTHYLVDQICQELETGLFKWFHTHALMKAQSKDYIRASQRRLLVDPVAAALSEDRTISVLTQRLDQIRQQLQADSSLQTGYASTNLLHLLLALGIDLQGADFSGLTLRQAHLQNVTLWDIDFTGVDLTEATFTGILGITSSVAYSPDGRLLAASTQTGEIPVWRVADQQQQAVLTGHQGVVVHVVFSPNGRWLASCGFDATIRIWDIENQICMAVLKGHTQCVNATAFSPYGTRLLSCSVDGSVRLWDLSTINADIPCVRTFNNFKGQVRRALFSPDGQFFATGGSAQIVQLWDVATGQCQQTLVGHRDEIKSLLFSPDGQMLISASKDSTVRIWDLASGQQRHLLDQHQYSVEEVAITPNGQYLASACIDRLVRLWDMRTGQLRQIFVGHTSGVKGIAFSPDGEQMASAATDQTVRLWDVKRGQPLYTLMGHRNELQTMSLSHDGTFLAAYRPAPEIHFWHLLTGDLLPFGFNYEAPHTAMAFHPQQPILAVNEAGRIAIHSWQTDPFQPTIPKSYLPGDTSDTVHLQFSPNGLFLAGFGEGSVICLWDLSDQTNPYFYQLQKHTRNIGGLAFHPDSSRLVASDYDRQLYVWALSSNNLPQIVDKIETPRAYKVALGIAIHPNGRLLACGCCNAICLIELPSGKIVDVLAGPVGWVKAIEFSPDGQWLFSGDEAPKVQVWDVQQCKLVHNMFGHAGAINGLVCRADSQSVYSCSRDGTIKVWNVQTGRCQQTLEPKGPYTGMKIHNVKGVTDAQKHVLRALGAVE